MASKIEKIKEEVAAEPPLVTATVNTDGVIAEGDAVPDKAIADPNIVPAPKPKRKRAPKQAVVPGVPVGVEPSGNDGGGLGGCTTDTNTDPEPVRGGEGKASEIKRPAEGGVGGNVGKRGIFKKVIYYREPTRSTRAPKSKSKSVPKQNAKSAVYGEDSDEVEELSDEFEDEEDDDDDYDDNDEESDGYGDDNEDDGMFFEYDDEPEEERLPPKKRAKKAVTKPRAPKPSPVPVDTRPVANRPNIVKKKQYTFV